MAEEKWRLVVLILMITWMSLLQVHCHLTPEQSAEKNALYRFFQNTEKKPEVNWSMNTGCCNNWLGVKCNEDNSVMYLRLPGKSFIGQIPLQTIGSLTKLRKLSLRNNGLYGEIPSDFSGLQLINTLNLRNNKLSGSFPTVITKLTLLKYLDLSGNMFFGRIPCEIQELPILLELRLEDNLFGYLPGLHVRKSMNFSVANNSLIGAIPNTLSHFPVEAFTGNHRLCGKPLSTVCNNTLYQYNYTLYQYNYIIYQYNNSLGPYCPFQPSEQNPEVATAAMSGGGFLLLLLFLIILLCPVRRKQNPTRNSDQSRIKPQSMSFEKGRSKLVIFPENELQSKGASSWADGLDVSDIMSGSVMEPPLPKGKTWTSYKVELAVTVTDKVLVVKNLTDPEAVVTDELDFACKMEFLGNIRHGNLMPLRGYCIYNEEYFLIYDFFPDGSLYHRLHGTELGELGELELEWESRRRIALAAARGLTHLHTAIKLVHGNIKSSNILLFRTQHSAVDACLVDFGLTAPSSAAYYEDQEKTKKATLASDVYAFGVLLLELLTGKSPDDINLAELVQSSAGVWETDDIWDSKLRKQYVDELEKKRVEVGMVYLLQIAKQCTHESADERPTMEKVVRMMENIHVNISRDEIDYLDPVDEKLGHEFQPPPPAITP